MRHIIYIYREDTETAAKFINNLELMEKAIAKAKAALTPGADGKLPKNIREAKWTLQGIKNVAEETAKGIERLEEARYAEATKAVSERELVKRHIKKMTDRDWQLFTCMRDEGKGKELDTAARALNTALYSLVSRIADGRKSRVDEARTKMDAAHSKFSGLGAYDSEPCWHRESWVKTAGHGWGELAKRVECAETGTRYHEPW